MVEKFGESLVEVTVAEGVPPLVTQVLVGACCNENLGVSRLSTCVHTTEYWVPNSQAYMRIIDRICRLKSPARTPTPTPINVHDVMLT